MLWLIANRLSTAFNCSFLPSGHRTRATGYGDVRLGREPRARLGTCSGRRLVCGFGCPQSSISDACQSTRGYGQDERNCGILMSQGGVRGGNVPGAKRLEGGRCRRGKVSCRFGLGEVQGKERPRRRHSRQTKGAADAAPFSVTFAVA